MFINKVVIQQFNYGVSNKQYCPLFLPEGVVLSAMMVFPEYNLCKFCLEYFDVICSLIVNITEYSQLRTH